MLRGYRPNGPLTGVPEPVRRGVCIRCGGRAGRGRTRAVIGRVRFPVALKGAGEIRILRGRCWTNLSCRWPAEGSACMPFGLAARGAPADRPRQEMDQYQKFHQRMIQKPHRGVLIESAGARRFSRRTAIGHAQGEVANGALDLAEMGRGLVHGKYIGNISYFVQDLSCAILWTRGRYTVAARPVIVERPAASRRDQRTDRS